MKTEIGLEFRTYLKRESPDLLEIGKRERARKREKKGLCVCTGFEMQGANFSFRSFALKVADSIKLRSWRGWC